MTYAITYRPDEEEENMLREMKYHRYLPSYQSALSKGIRILYREYQTDKEAEKVVDKIA